MSFPTFHHIRLRLQNFAVFRQFFSSFNTSSSTVFDLRVEAPRSPLFRLRLRNQRPFSVLSSGSRTPSRAIFSLVSTVSDVFFRCRIRISMVFSDSSCSGISKSGAGSVSTSNSGDAPNTVHSAPAHHSHPLHTHAVIIIDKTFIIFLKKSKPSDTHPPIGYNRQK